MDVFRALKCNRADARSMCYLQKGPFSVSLTFGCPEEGWKQTTRERKYHCARCILCALMSAKYASKVQERALWCLHAKLSIIYPTINEMETPILLYLVESIMQNEFSLLVII